MMTNRERILAVVRGDPVDRVPFVMYDELLPTAEVQSLLGPGRMGLMKWCKIYRVDHPHCQFETEEFDRDGKMWRRNSVHTPSGMLFEEIAYEPGYGSGSIQRHFIETSADYEYFWELLDDAHIRPDYDQYDAVQAKLGEDGVPLVAVERTPYQQLWVEWTGLDNLVYHLADFPDRVQRSVDLLAERARKIYRIAAESPAPFVDVPDNITAPTIGTDRFRRYCMPFYNELADLLSSSGRSVFVHMDGDLKPLWDAIGSSMIGGIDSFSPAPDNDTTVADAVREWPGMTLFVNFPSSQHLRKREEIMKVTTDILDCAASTGRLQIQLSENVPAHVWRTSVPAIADAIDTYFS